MKKTIMAEHAPPALGPYSHAVVAGDFVYSSGQTALDPATGKMIEGDVAAEARQTLNNLKAVLNAAGADFSQVVKCMVFLTDMADFAAVNSVYIEAFPENPPARSCVAVAALPAGAKVEIEAIAFLG